MYNSNKSNITKKEISELGITKVYLCNFFSKGKLFYSLNEDIEVLAYNIGNELTEKEFDSYIEAKFQDGELKSLMLVELKSGKCLYKIEGIVLEHFLKLPVFNYDILSTQKNRNHDKSGRKTFITNLYKYVVSKAANGSISI